MASNITVEHFICEYCKKQQYLPPGHERNSHIDFCKYVTELKESSDSDQKMLITSNFLLKLSKKQAQLQNALHTCEHLHMQVHLQNLNQAQLFVENPHLRKRHHQEINKTSSKIQNHSQLLHEFHHCKTIVALLQKLLTKAILQLIQQ